LSTSSVFNRAVRREKYRLVLKMIDMGLSMDAIENKKKSNQRLVRGLGFASWPDLKFFLLEKAVVMNV
jgi:hypothetical protein